MSSDASPNPFDGPQLQSTTFSRADMTACRLDGVNLSDALVYALMTNATFRNCNMTGTAFDDVNLTGARFDNIDLSRVTMDNVNLSGLQITNANLSNASIKQADMTGMTINDIPVADLLAAYEAQVSK